jgi:hypothetical protein
MPRPHQTDVFARSGLAGCTDRVGDPGADEDLRINVADIRGVGEIDVTRPRLERTPHQAAVAPSQLGG